MSAITDPIFYAAAVPAVILVGLSKGGFGGTLAMIGVPLMALVVSPLQAAGIMLPILIVMDAVAVLAYRGKIDRRSLIILFPAAFAGIGVGWATAAFVNEALVRLLVGIISLLFVADHVFRSKDNDKPATHNTIKGTLCGFSAGFTSFVSHSGGPPFQLYMIPLRLAPSLFAGTAVVFFAAVNTIKLIPYFFLGQFGPDNLATSLVLLPLALIATLAGVWLVKLINEIIFYRFIYMAMSFIGVKLIWDGLFNIIPA